MENKNINLIVTESRREEVLKEIGYDIDKEGFLVDRETKEKIKAEDGKEINIKEDKHFALISGTHTFVRNIAGYSHLLTKKGLVTLYLKED